MTQTQQAQTWLIRRGLCPLHRGLRPLLPQPPNLTQHKDGHPIVNSRGKHQGETPPTVGNNKWYIKLAIRNNRWHVPK